MSLPRKDGTTHLIQQPECSLPDRPLTVLPGTLTMTILFTTMVLAQVAMT